METKSVGIREFRENISTYVLESSEPVTITKHGDAVGYFIPAKRKKLTDEERLAMAARTQAFYEHLASRGVTEEDVVEDFERLRRGENL